MANISTYLSKILTAVYGEEVRGSIHDAISAMNTESANAMQYAATAQDSARASATAASNSASTATQKANEASTSAQSAMNSETNAASKASQAVTAANNAKASETAAANSESVAVQKASEAAVSRDAAASSAEESAQSAVSAQQYSGKPPKPINGTWWIWDADSQDYVDSTISCELVGPAGNGIKGIDLTSGDHTPGTTDIYTATMTDGTSCDISVYNGRNGTGAGDILGVSFDLLIPASEWLDGEITIADSQFVALSTYKYFLSAYEDSRAEFLECNVRPKDISTTGFISFESDTTPTTDIKVNIVRFELSANGTE